MKHFRLLVIAGACLFALSTFIAAEPSKSSNPFPPIEPLSETAHRIIGVVYSPETDKLTIENPIYHPQTDKLQIKNPIYRPGKDKLTITKL